MATRRKVQSGMPTAEAWESHRDEIKRLYRQEQKTIKQVQQLMNQRHRFSATPRMYQARIQRWNLDKKLKAPEVAYALDLIASRRGMGKETKIYIRGLVVSEEKLREYARRSRAIPEGETAAQPAVVALTPPCEGSPPSSMSSSGESAPNLSAMFPGDRSQTTRRPDPELSLNGNTSLSTSIDEKFDSRTAVPPRLWQSSACSSHEVAHPASASSLPHALLPQRASTCRNVLAHIDIYYQDFFQRWEPRLKEELNFGEPQCSRLPKVEPTQYLCVLSSSHRQADPARIVFWVDIACQLFRRGRYGPGRYLLDLAFDRIETLLMDEPPPLLACLLSVVCLLDSLKLGVHHHTDRPDVLTLFLTYVSEMAKIKLRSGHPITELFLSFADVRGDHYYVAESALRRIVGIFRSKAGPLHPYHYRLTYLYACVLIRRDQFDTARDLLEQLLNGIECHADRDELHSRASRCLLAQVYLALHQFSRAELCLQKIIDRAIQVLGEDGAYLVTLEAWRMRAVIANFHNRLDDKNMFKQQALECAQLLYGPQHLRVIQVQREIDGLEPWTAPEEQWRFICSFPAFEVEANADMESRGVL